MPHRPATSQDWSGNESHDEMYGSAWGRASRAYRRANPLCVRCKRQGLATMAQCVDHIIPHGGDWRRFWDVDNWQPLCRRCHDQKTCEEKGQGEISKS